jgi:ankyrin repeat protein
MKEIVNFQASNGNTPLHYAAIRGNIDVINILFRFFATGQIIK